MERSRREVVEDEYHVWVHTSVVGERASDEKPQI